VRFSSCDDDDGGMLACCMPHAAFATTGIFLIKIMENHANSSRIHRTLSHMLKCNRNMLRRLMMSGRGQKALKYLHNGNGRTKENYAIKKENKFIKIYVCIFLKGAASENGNEPRQRHATCQLFKHL